MPYIAPKLDKDGKKIRPDGAKPTYTDMASGAWTNSGGKRARLQGIFFI